MKIFDARISVNSEQISICAKVSTELESILNNYAAQKAKEHIIVNIRYADRGLNERKDAFR